MSAINSVTAPVARGTVSKGRLTGKGLLVVFVLGIVGGLVAIFINNNVDKVSELTEARSSWRNLWGIL